MEHASVAGSAPARLRQPARLLRLASDERLVASLRAGDERAFEVLFDRHHRAILGFCRHMLGSREEAEDAVQHTFLGAYRDLVDSDKAIDLRPWLFAIARNRCLSLLRARREHATLELAEPATEGLSATVERREDLRELLHDVAQLPDDQRAALLLAEVGALDHAGIAAVLGCPREKVKALVFQARSSLIAGRDARAAPCEQIRVELATASGAALRRGPLRRHLRACPGCRAFKAEIADQRRQLALLLPVAPGVALKAGVLSGIGTGGGAGAAAGTGATAATCAVAGSAPAVGGATGAGAAASGAAGAGASAATGGLLGGTAGALGATGAAKVAVSLALAGAVAGGGALAIEQERGTQRERDVPAAHGDPVVAPAPLVAAGAAPPAATTGAAGPRAPGTGSGDRARGRSTGRGSAGTRADRRGRRVAAGRGAHPAPVARGRGRGAVPAAPSAPAHPGEQAQRGAAAPGRGSAGGAPGRSRGTSPPAPPPAAPRTGNAPGRHGQRGAGGSPPGASTGPPATRAPPAHSGGPAAPQPESHPRADPNSGSGPQGAKPDPPAHARGVAESPHKP